MADQDITFTLRLKSELDAALKKVTTSVKGSEKQIKTALQAIKQSGGKNVQGLKKDFEKLEASLKEVTKAVKVSEKQIKKSLGDTEQAGGENLRGLKEDFKKIDEAMGGLGGRIGALVKKFGPLVLVLAVVTLGFVGLGKSIQFAVQEGSAFEQSMANLNAITNPTAKGFANLEAQARQLGATTAFSAKEAGDAFIELGKLGLTTNQIIGASQAVLNLAAASGENMAAVAETTAASLAQFQLKASDATEITDVMAKSFTTSALDLGRFSEAMKFAGPVAKGTGQSFKQTTSALGVLANSAIVGSQAGTALRRVMIELDDTGSKVSKVLQDSGSSAKTFQEKLKDLQKIGVGESTSQLKNLFGLLSVTGAKVLIDSADKVGEFEKVLDKAGGTAKIMSEKRLNTLNGQIKILQSGLSELGIRLFSTFGKRATESIKNLQQGVIDLIKFVERNRQAFAFWGTFVLTVIDEIVKAVRGVALVTEIAFKSAALVIVKVYELAANAVITSINIIIKGLNFIKSESNQIKPIELFQSGEGQLAGEIAAAASALAKIGNETQTITFDVKTKAAGGDVVKGPSEPAAAVTGLPSAKVLKGAQAELDKVLQEGVLARINKELGDSEARIFALQAEQNRRLEILRKGGIDTLAAEQIFADQLTALKIKEAAKQEEIAKRSKEKQEQLDKKAFQNKVKMAQLSIGLAQNGVALAKEIFGENKAIKTAEALVNTAAGVTNALGSSPPPFNFINAGLVGAIGAAQIAKINGAKFANGGVVGGSSFSGDKVNAFVNSGEMILNRGQQRKLFDLANGQAGNQQTFGDTNITIGAPQVTITGPADGDTVRNAVSDALDGSKLNLARLMREIQEDNVVA